MTSRRERIEAVLEGEVADRLPVALWRHFPVDDQEAASLAEAHAAFQREFDFDFLKVTPASSFCLRDWGVEDAWRGNPEGTRDYTLRVIARPEDWGSLQPLDPTVGSLGEQLRCLGLLADELGSEVPVIQTIFSPLAQAKNLAGEDRLFEHLHQSPDQVCVGLETITQTTVDFVEAARGRGIAGIFYAVQHATYRFFDEQAYARFGEAYDLRILEAAGGLWLNVLHLHGVGVMFGLAERYPIQVVNWHDRETAPDLMAGQRRIRGAVCGGLSRWETMVLGDPARVREEAGEAARALGGRGLILGTGCVVPVIAPRGNLLAARQSVEA